MTSITQARIEKTLAVIIATAIAGERCPQNEYGKGIESAALNRLAKTGWIKVLYSSTNYRTIHILKGPHKGKHTAPDTSGNKVYAVLDCDGHKRLPVTDNSHRTARARPSMPRYSFLQKDST